MKTLIQQKWKEHGYIWMLTLLQSGKDNYMLVRFVNKNSGIQETMGTLEECYARVATFETEAVEPMEVEA